METELTRLNEIAGKWTETDEYPVGTSATDVQELAQPLYDQFKDRIDTVAHETPLTRREAEVSVLKNTIDEHHNPLTEDAIALLFSTPNTGFGDATDADEVSDTNKSVTNEEINQHATAARRKYEDARQTVGALTFPDRDDALTTPKLVWLDQTTVQRLKGQRHSDENTFDEVVTRCLDQTETQRTLEEFVRGYLNARGKDNVAQVAIDQEGFKTGALLITAHTHVKDDLPDIVTETHAITYDGNRYVFSFEESRMGPSDLGRITLYASDNIIGMDETKLEDGLAAAKEHMQEVL